MKITVFKYELISLCHFHLHFLWCSPTHQKYPARAHTSSQNWDAVLLLCRCPMQSSPLETDGLSREKSLSFQHFLPELGWLKGWKVHQHDLGAPGVLCRVMLPQGCRCFTSLWQLSPLLQPALSPCLAKQKALQCMEIQNCSPAISFMAVMEKLLYHILVPLRGIKGPNQEWGFHLKFLSVMEITETAELQISAVHCRGRLGFQVIESQTLKLGKDL